MRIALHSPSTPSEHGATSGAAAAAGALADALSMAGHAVNGPDGPGMAAGAVEIALEDVDRPGRRPDLWLTYGLRDDAPDRLGPTVAARLKIPYVLVDPRGAAGDDPRGAQAVIALSDASAQWAAESLPEVPMSRLLPFIDPGPYDSVRRQHAPQAASIAMRHGLDRESPRLLHVGAMLPGDNLESYRLLARALSRLALIKWQLIVVGDGPMRGEVDALLRRLPLGRVHAVGALPPEDVIPFYAISDLLLAPCAGGTHGRVLLEAQATGLPVVACDAPGVRDAVKDGMTGRLGPEGNAEAMAQTITFLLREQAFLKGYAAATAQAISKDHHIALAAASLDEILTELVGG